MSTYCVYKTSFLPLRISQSVVKSKNVGNYNKKKRIAIVTLTTAQSIIDIKEEPYSFVLFGSREKIIKTILQEVTHELGFKGHRQFW